MPALPLLIWPTAPKLLIAASIVCVTPEALEVRAFAPAEIPWDEIAFKTSWWAIRDWVTSRHPDVPVPDRFAGVEPL